MVLRTAILDGVPVDRPDGRKLFARGDGLLLVAEVAYLFRPTSKDSPRTPHFRLGRVAGLRPYTTKIALGSWHYTRRVTAFGQFGVGDARVNHFASYTGAGIVMPSARRESGGDSGMHLSRAAHFPTGNSARSAARK